MKHSISSPWRNPLLWKDQWHIKGSVSIRRVHRTASKLGEHCMQHAHHIIHAASLKGLKALGELDCENTSLRTRAGTTLSMGNFGHNGLIRYCTIHACTLESFLYRPFFSFVPRTTHTLQTSFSLSLSHTQNAECADTDFKGILKLTQSLASTPYNGAAPPLQSIARRLGTQGEATHRELY